MGEGLRGHGLRVTRAGRAVLDGVTFALRPGEISCLTGPSGAGKSTLLRALVRLVALDGGSVTLDGVDVTTIDARALRRSVGFVAQAPAMLPGSVAENLRYGVAGCDLDAALAAAGLEPGFAGRAAAELSGGERARVALARALTRAPRLLLLDEPTAALDSTLADRLGARLRHLSERDGLGICVATHDRAFAESWGDRVEALTAARCAPAPP